MTRRVAVAVATATLAVATSAQARVPGDAGDAVTKARFVYLRGKDTASCPSEGDVRVAVQTRLGYDPFASYASSTMFAEVSAADRGFAASLKLVDADSSVRGDRTLRAERCADLMDAMALTISIAIDPMSVTRNGPPPDAPPSERPVDTTVAPPEASVPLESADATDHPSEPPPKEKPIGLFVGLGPLGSLGSAPGVAFGGALALEARRGALVAALEARGDLPASAAVGELGRVESSLVAGTLFGGIKEGWVVAGAVGTVGELSASSSDVRTSRRREALYLGAGFRVGVAIPLNDRVEARVRADVLANLLRHTLEISGREAYEYPIASANLGAAIAVRFW